jgi:hypothetical protein
MKTRRMTVVAMMLMIVFFAIASQSTATPVPPVTVDPTASVIPTTTPTDPAVEPARRAPAPVQTPARPPRRQTEEIKPPEPARPVEVKVQPPADGVLLRFAVLYAAARAAEAKAAADRASLNAGATRIAATRTLTAAVGGIAFSVAAVVLFLILPLLRPKPSPKPEPKETKLAARLEEATGKLEARLQIVADRVQKTSEAIEARLATAIVATPDHLRPILDEVRAMRGDIVNVGHEVAQLTSKPAPAAATAATDPVALERQVLAEWWKLFRANGELSAAFDAASQDSAWDPLLRDLTKTVPQDLKPTFDAVVAPWREHRHLIQKIAYVPRLVSGDVERLPDAEELRRMREFADLLKSAQSSADAPSRLTFRFKNWVTDAFLPFADLFLQRYQQARLDNRHRELETGVALVIDLLRVAAVEPIDVTPGETPFDSTRHIGRSTTNDQRFADGVITGVVRNGFIEGGQQVIRQPEVIVNRLR